MYKKVKNILLVMVIGIVMLIMPRVTLANSKEYLGVNEKSYVENNFKEEYFALGILVLLVGARGLFAIYQFDKTNNFLKRERDKAKKTLENPSDGTWVYDNLISRAKVCFSQVNKSINENNSEIATGYISENFYKNIENRKTRNLENIKILKVVPMKAIDKIDDEKDLIILIIQFIVNESDCEKVFEETWTYVKRNRVWVVDDFSEFNVGITLERFEKI